jgi:hypothetical protein
MKKEAGRVITIEDGDSEETSGIGDLVEAGDSFVEITEKDGSKQKGKMFRFHNIIYFQNEDQKIRNVFTGREEAICTEVRELVGEAREDVRRIFEGN